MLFVPLMNGGVPIGIISATRVQPGSFADHHVQLLQTFADQAVIAIENARLFKEVKQRTEDLTESLQQQTATADVLKVISRSAFDLQTVMNTLTRSASELCGADIGALFLREGDVLVTKGHSKIADELTEFLRKTRIRVDDDSYMGHAVLNGEIANIPDFENAPATKVRVFQQTLGFKSILMVPLMREGRGIGVFALARNRIGEYSQRQVELVQTFADQAVIAIENVRLFDEVQAKTRDLSEALTYQTGSGNILKVIASSPTEVGPVLRAIADNACEVCDAYDAAVLLQDGEDLRFWAHHGPIPIGIEKWPINRHWTVGRAFLDKQPVHLHDLLAD
jgi:GAF domain-containing protein